MTIEYVSYFKQENFTIKDVIDAGQLMEGFSKLLQKKKNTPRQEKPELDACAYDRMLGGCLVLSILLVNTISELVDFEVWDEGVFCYEYLGYCGKDPCELPAWIYPKLDWYQISEDHSMPDDASLKVLITEWMQFCGLPFKKVDSHGED